MYWFVNYRTQRDKVMQSISNSIDFNTGILQGCVLSPLLFVLYTSDLKCGSNLCSIVKCADDTSVTGFISHDDETAHVVMRLYAICWLTELHRWRWRFQNSECVESACSAFHRRCQHRLVTEAQSADRHSLKETLACDSVIVSPGLHWKLQYYSTRYSPGTSLG